MRSRFLVSKKNKCLVITNYKCGYTSLNKESTLKRVKGIQYIYENQRDYNIIYIYRDPVKRFLSFAHNWFFDKVENPHLTNLKRAIGDTNYNTFINLVENDNHLDALKYLFTLGRMNKFIKMNEHSYPQVNIFSKYIDNIRIDYYINLDSDNDIDLLNKILSIQLGKCNSSSRKDTNLYENDKDLKSCIEKLYQVDVEFINSIVQKKELEKN